LSRNTWEGSRGARADAEVAVLTLLLVAVVVVGVAQVGSAGWLPGGASLAQGGTLWWVLASLVGRRRASEAQRRAGLRGPLDALSFIRSEFTRREREEEGAR
jgi:hypothetical protein